MSKSRPGIDGFSPYDRTITFSISGRLLPSTADIEEERKRLWAAAKSREIEEHLKREEEEKQRETERIQSVTSRSKTSQKRPPSGGKGRGANTKLHSLEERTRQIVSEVVGEIPSEKEYQFCLILQSNSVSSPSMRPGEFCFSIEYRIHITDVSHC